MSPRTPERNERIRAASRARIIEYALRLFATHGYDRTTIKRIASDAGISQGLIYNYFESKAALLGAIFEQSVADVQASFAEAEAAGPPGERIERLVRASFRVVRRHEAFWRLSYGLRMQVPVLAEMAERVHGWSEMVRDTLERYLREAGVAEPAAEAAVLFATIDGVAQHYVLDPGGYPLDAVIERIVARYRAVPEG